MSEQREKEPAPAADAVEPPQPADAPAPESAIETTPPPTEAPAESAAAEEQLPSVPLLTGETAEGKPSTPPEAPKPIDPALAEGAVEAPYEWQPFTLPEGLTQADLNQERVAELQGIVTTKDLSPQDLAQKLLDLHAAEMRAYDQATLQRQMRAFENTQIQWRKDFAGDREIGGAGAKTSQIAANAAIRRILSDDHRYGERLAPAQNGDSRQSDRKAFTDMLLYTGAGNHPEMVRFLSRIENLLRESAREAPAAGPSAVPRDIGSRRPNRGAGNPGPGGQRRVRDFYDHPSSQDALNGGDGKR